MNNFINPKHLRQEQYRNPQNLDARVSLHRRFSTNPYPWHHWVFDHLNFAEGVKILEIGCGPGYLWGENYPRVPKNGRITLMDISRGMVESARKNLSAATNFAYLTNDAQHLPLASNAFDAIIANHMLYHVPNIELALGEIRRVLRANGTCYSTTNGFSHLLEIWAWVQAALPERHDILSSREIVLRYSLENGQGLLSKHFDLVNLIRFPDSLEITEVQPVVDFVASSSIQVNLSHEEISRYREFLERKIGNERVLRVTKDMGIFVARSDSDD